MGGLQALGETIYRLRKEEGLTQDEFGARYDVSGPAIFKTEIGPKLKTVSWLETMRATGLSRTYCGMIRRGVRIPHPRHWGVLRTLVD